MAIRTKLALKSDNITAENFQGFISSAELEKAPGRNYDALHDLAAQAESFGMKLALVAVPLPSGTAEADVAELFCNCISAKYGYGK